jgi:N-hydroxyarylamine O-acetyltransferase
MLKQNLDHYFKLIGYSGERTPTLTTLKELHYLHTLKFPFENLTPFLYQEVKLDLESLNQKFLYSSRGGYCFEQNIFFSEVLKSLGFEVTTHAARVVWNQDENMVARRSHMIFLVHLEGESYLADVGFGGLTLTTPLLFKPHLEQQTTHELFRIGNLDKEYKLEAKIKDQWKTLYRFDLQEQNQLDYEVMNFYLFTHPESLFRNNLIAARPAPEGRYALKNNVFTWYPKNGAPEEKILNSSIEVEEVLKSIFNLRLPPELSERKRITELLESLKKAD